MAFYHKICWLGVALFLTSCGESSISEVGEINAKDLYESYCTTCHGSNGDLGISGAADLSISEKTQKEKTYIITQGSENGKMLSYKGLLTEREIEEVAKYIETLKK